MGRARSTCGGKRNTYRVLVDNIKMDLREIGWYGMDRIDVAQDRDYWRVPVNMCSNFGFHKTLGNS
jgi:hypothetical protein